MRILIPIDDSKGSNATLSWASQFLDKNNAQLFLLTIYPETAIGNAEEMEQVNQILETGKTFLLHHGFQVIESASRLGSPVETICGFADEKQIDEIIMGSHFHHTLTEQFMGTVSQKVFEEAHQPVLVLNHTQKPFLEISHLKELTLIEEERHPYKILLPLDGSEASKRTLAWLPQFLNPKQSEIYLLNIYDFSPEGGYRYPSKAESEKILKNAEHQLKQDGFKINAVEYRCGTPALEICEYAEEQNIDEIILGTRGHHEVEKYFMGSTTQEVFQQASCPVIIFNNTEKPFLKISQQE